MSILSFPTRHDNWQQQQVEEDLVVVVVIIILLRRTLLNFVELCQSSTTKTKNAYGGIHPQRIGS